MAELKQLKLMIPGPVQPEEDVLDVMGSPVAAHYGAEWTRFYNETTEMLKSVFGTQGNVFLINGSGTAGIDACLGSALSSGEKILVGDNGFFGDRMIWVAQAYNLEAVPVRAEWGLPLTAQAFADALRQHTDAKAIAVVHLETSTTVVNPIAEIGVVARQAGVYYFVDAVSSLGGLSMKMDEWGIDLCASASQKCLGAPPGLSPVAVGPRGWEAINRNPKKGHGWYLDLAVWRWYVENWGDWHPFPVTMATSNIRALRLSLERLMQEGIENRLKRYHSLALHLRSGLRRIGLEPYTPDELLAPVLTAAYGPDGVPTGKIVDYLAEQRGIKISGGLGTLKDKIIRIGHMSPTTSEADIDEVLTALECFPNSKL